MNRLLIGLFVHFFLWCLTIPACATDTPREADAKSRAMGNASLTFSNAFSIFNNPAGIALADRNALGVSYINHFMLQATGTSTLSGLIHLGNIGSLGVGVRTFGYTQYQENDYALAYAKTFGPHLSMALKGNLLTQRFIEPYGSKSIFYVDFGMLYEFDNESRIAAHWHNPTRVWIDQQVNDRVPTTLSVAYSYLFSEKLKTVIQLDKNLDFQPQVKVGIEYRPVKKWAIRGGVESFPVQLSFGAGWELKDLIIDAATAFHQNLGFVPSMSLRYRFKNKSSDN